MIERNVSDRLGFKKWSARSGAEECLIDHVKFVLGDGEGPGLALALLYEFREGSKAI
jgi:hypothetical protein